MLLGFTEFLLQHFLGADHDLLLVDVDFLLYLHLQLSLDLVQPRFQVLCLYPVLQGAGQALLYALSQLYCQLLVPRLTSLLQFIAFGLQGVHLPMIGLDQSSEAGIHVGQLLGLVLQSEGGLGDGADVPAVLAQLLGHPGDRLLDFGGDCLSYLVARTDFFYFLLFCLVG